MLAATQANPLLWQIAGDLIIKAMDWPFAKEIAERIKKSIPPQITGDEEAMAAMQPQPDPMQEMAARLAAEEARATIEERYAKVDKMEAETAKIEAETQVLGVRTAVDVQRANDDRQMQRDRFGFEVAKAEDDVNFRDRQSQQTPV
jgi:hypothetical protein